jgi:hypothetical protein
MKKSEQDTRLASQRQQLVDWCRQQQQRIDALPEKERPGAAREAGDALLAQTEEEQKAELRQELDQSQHERQDELRAVDAHYSEKERAPGLSPAQRWELSEGHGQDVANRERLLERDGPAERTEKGQALNEELADYHTSKFEQANTAADWLTAQYPESPEHAPAADPPNGPPKDPEEPAPPEPPSPQAGSSPPEPAPVDSKPAGSDPAGPDPDPDTKPPSGQETGATHGAGAPDAYDRLAGPEPPSDVRQSAPDAEHARGSADDPPPPGSEQSSPSSGSPEPAPPEQKDAYDRLAGGGPDPSAAPEPAKEAAAQDAPEKPAPDAYDQLSGPDAPSNTQSEPIRENADHDHEQ